MKPYGVPRDLDVESPDKGDITNFGLAPGRHGEKRRSNVKREARRLWKKKERTAAKKNCVRLLMLVLSEVND